MKTIQVEMREDGSPILPKGHADFVKIDATTDQDIAQQKNLDDEAALLDAR